MDLRNQQRQAAARPQPQHTARPTASTTDFRPAHTPKRSSGRIWAIIAAVAVVVVLLGGLAWWKMGSTAPASGQYQAVFLDNGQVFFGKLKNTEGTYLRVEDAYYTKKQDLPADATEEQKKAVDNNVSLVKVGNEVYGPENSLNIKAEQVLFWQNLKTDSKVAKAIESAKSE